jgi:hypothetical protein
MKKESSWNGVQVVDVKTTKVIGTIIQDIKGVPKVNFHVQKRSGGT